ncbi:phytanoyl-CoA dioxygenase family protein [Kitasatospora sp. NPDC048239]|uniref:phytanoyl-CoA dioxygenase family protein n=1 Tax=Kitasatospora sp. NPDC048239 TaxID=3364046 RepID=UPI00371C79A0
MTQILSPGEELLDAFRANGFSTLPKLVDESELEWLRGVYDRLFENYLSADPGDYYDISGDGTGVAQLPQIIRPEKYAPELVESAHFARCRSIASAFLGVPESELDFYGHAILKPAEYGAPTPWHQDEAYMSPHWHRRGLSIWTPLDGASVESGCLHFVPGLHRGPVLPHRHIDHDDRVRGLMTDEVDPAAAVACPLEAGEASVHDFRTPHYAGPNHTSRARRAYVLVFMGPATAVEDPEPRPWRTQD